MVPVDLIDHLASGAVFVGFDGFEDDVQVPVVGLADGVYRFECDVVYGIPVIEAAAAFADAGAEGCGGNLLDFDEVFQEIQVGRELGTALHCPEGLAPVVFCFLGILWFDIDETPVVDAF